MSYNELINIKYHLYHIFIIITAIVIIITIYILNIKIYSAYNTKGFIKNSKLVLNIPIENSEVIINGEYLVIEDKKYNYEIENISEILLSNNINYQEIILNLKNDFKENSIIETTIYYDKEKVATKIKKIISGG